MCYTDGPRKEARPYRQEAYVLSFFSSEKSPLPRNVHSSIGYGCLEWLAGFRDMSLLWIE